MGKLGKQNIVIVIEIWLKWQVQRPNYFHVCSWILKQLKVAMIHPINVGTDSEEAMSFVQWHSY